MGNKSVYKVLINFYVSEMCKRVNETCFFNISKSSYILKISRTTMSKFPSVKNKKKDMIMIERSLLALNELFNTSITVEYLKKEAMISADDCIRSYRENKEETAKSAPFYYFRLFLCRMIKEYKGGDITNYLIAYCLCIHHGTIKRIKETCMK